jgi:hypothetical protein
LLEKPLSLKTAFSKIFLDFLWNLKILETYSTFKKAWNLLVPNVHTVYTNSTQWTWKWLQPFPLGSPETSPPFPYPPARPKQPLTCAQTITQTCPTSARAADPSTNCIFAPSQARIYIYQEMGKLSIPLLSPTSPRVVKCLVSLSLVSL